MDRLRHMPYHVRAVVLTTNRGDGAAGAFGAGTSRSSLSIAENEIHVWRTGLDQPPWVLDRVSAWLSADEHERARRFRFERDRSRYVVGRAVLRRLLAEYLDISPASVQLRYGPFAKPLLAQSGPWFNLSHSGPVALLAFSATSEIGIDVELDDADFARERIAERFFSPTEVAALRALPQALQARAFLTCWTRKEAFLKARGDGLSLALDSFDVTLTPGRAPELLRTAWCSGEPAQWSLHDISDPRPGYIAAIAQRAVGQSVRHFHLTDPIQGVMPSRQEDQ